MPLNSITKKFSNKIANSTIYVREKLINFLMSWVRQKSNNSSTQSITSSTSVFFLWSILLDFDSANLSRYVWMTSWWTESRYLSKLAKERKIDMSYFQIKFWDYWQNIVKFISLHTGCLKDWMEDSIANDPYSKSWEEVSKGLESTPMLQYIHYGIVLRPIYWSAGQICDTSNTYWDMDLSRRQKSIYMCGRMRSRKLRVL